MSKLKEKAILDFMAIVQQILHEMVLDESDGRMQELRNHLEEYARLISRLDQVKIKMATKQD